MPFKLESSNIEFLVLVVAELSYLATLKKTKMSILPKHQTFSPSLEHPECLLDSIKPAGA